MTGLCADIPVEQADKLFFSERPNNVRQAKAICGQCPERNQCLATATQNREPYGVWGGEDQVARRRRLGLNCYGTTR